MKRIAVPMDLQYAYPWHHETFQGIRQYAEQQGWSCKVDPHHLAILDGLDLSQCDGVVGRIDPQIMQAAEEAGIPAVTVITRPATSQVPSVTIDCYDAARMAANHLLSCGHRRLAYVGYEGSTSNESILQGLSEPLAEAGLPEPSVCLHSQDYDIDPEATARTIKQLSQWFEQVEKPVGILVWALYAARAMALLTEDRGFQVAKDVGIIVLEGDTTIVSSVDPTLSSLGFDDYQQGYQAAAFLDELLQGKAKPGHRLIQPKRVIVRESTDVFVCSDPMVSAAMQFIAKNARFNLAADEVADNAGVSRRTLERKFEEVLGKTVFNEIRRIRVEHIQRQLIDTDKTIAAIAEEFDFQEANHLSRYFRKETGESPSEYRQRFAELWLKQDGA